ARCRPQADAENGKDGSARDRSGRKAQSHETGRVDDAARPDQLGVAPRSHRQRKNHAESSHALPPVLENTTSAGDRFAPPQAATGNPSARSAPPCAKRNVGGRTYILLQ